MINSIFKFSLSFFFLLFSASVSFAQNTSLPVVFATGGGGKNVVYKKPTKDERDNMNGYVWGDCSNCLGSEDCNIVASSTLSTQGVVNYLAKNIQDDDPTTAWVEGDSEYGIGEYIEIKKAVVLTSLSIYNGYQKSPKSFIENSRVKTLRVSENGIDRCIIRLKDEMGGQSISVEKLGLKLNHGEILKIRFTIMEVYPGTKFKDVAISELFSDGCCISGKSEIRLSTDEFKKIQDIKINDSIKLIDNNNNIIYGFKTEVGTLIHDRVLEIITEKGNSIVVSPNHFIFSGSYNKKIQARQLTPNDSLLVQKDENKIVQDKIVKIIPIDKPTETFYFKNMEFGNQQIAWPVRAIFNNIITADEYLDKMNKLHIPINKSASNSVQSP